MKDPGIIRAKRGVGALDETTYIYWWEGGKIAKISGSLLDDLFKGPRLRIGRSFRLGELHLQVIAYDRVWNQYDVMRKGPLAMIMVIITWLYRLLMLNWRRLIRTLNAWGLAECRQGMIPSAQDIHLVRWLRKCWLKSARAE